MKAIYKYELTERLNKILMPEKAKVLAFQCQPHIGLCLWAIVTVPDPQTGPPKRDPESGEVIAAPMVKTETRTFEVVGTGWPFDDKDHAEYIGTAQDRHQMVWHCFEVVKAAVVVAVETPKKK